MTSFSPKDLDSLSIYQIFPRNASPRGDLDGALPLLELAKELGFDYVYLTPVHPIGRKARKGSLGSPYAIADYRAVDPLLGGEAAFRRFLDRAHELGLGLLMDVVYNHTSPDSRLLAEHPEWFWKGPEEVPAPRVAEWSDVVDLDYAHRGLWDYQIETLEAWARFGVDGFRCDVASLVPVDFWIEARRRVAAVKPVLWLAESVHKEFVLAMRRAGFAAASDPELHAAFDLSYDYDAREELEAAWRGEASLEAYLRMLSIQESHYPARARKLRFLENHDQVRAASRFEGSRLRAWTLFAMLLPGSFLAYMGQESGHSRRIGLFDAEPLDETKGDPAFRSFFAEAHAATKRIRASRPRFAASLLAEGLVLVERSGGGGRSLALLNLGGLSGLLELPAPAAALLAEAVEGGARLLLGEEPRLLRGRLEIPRAGFLLDDPAR